MLWSWRGMCVCKKKKKKLVHLHPLGPFPNLSCLGESFLFENITSWWTLAPMCPGLFRHTRYTAGTYKCPEQCLEHLQPVTRAGDACAEFLLRRHVCLFLLIFGLLGLRRHLWALTVMSRRACPPDGIWCRQTDLSRLLGGLFRSCPPLIAAQRILVAI